MPDLLIIAVLLLAVFTQTVAGFGMAMVAIPLLSGLLPLPQAVALVTLIGVMVRFTNVLYYRRNFTVDAIWRLLITTFVGIPLGVIVLENVDGDIVRRVLGLVIVSYVLYSVFSPQIRLLARKQAAYGMGLLSGLLAGAYGIGAPPIIMYASAQNWEPAEFKANVQAYAGLEGLLVVAAHVIDGNYTPLVLNTFLIALPVSAVVLLLAVRLDRYIDPALFRKIVLGVLFISGLRLLLL